MRAGRQLLGRLGDGGIELKGKSPHGHGQQCGDCEVEEGMRDKC